MLFKRSIDGDSAFKQLLLEELVLEQLKYSQRPKPHGENGPMGFAWCMNLCRVRLAAERLKGSDAVLGSVVHAATQLARDIMERRQAELNAATSAIIDQDDHDQATCLLAFMESIPDLDAPAMAARLSPQTRALLLRLMDEAMHRLRVMQTKGNFKTLDAIVTERLRSFTPAQRKTLADSARMTLEELTARAPQYRFDSTLP